MCSSKPTAIAVGFDENLQCLDVLMKMLMFWWKFWWKSFDENVGLTKIYPLPSISFYQKC